MDGVKEEGYSLTIQFVLHYLSTGWYHKTYVFTLGETVRLVGALSQ